MNKSALQGFDIGGKSAAVIGCGGLGCNVSVHLAGAGIGKLVLADFDFVSESNLNRQFLYSLDDIGKPKCEAAAERLRKYAPGSEIITADLKITEKNIPDIIGNCDIIFLAADNNTVRAALQSFCRKNNIPLVNGGINAFTGTAYLYVPGKSACLDCAGLTEKETENISSVSSTAGVIGALQAEIGIRYLLGNDESAGILHIYDYGEINKLKIKPQKNCGLCGVK